MHNVNGATPGLGVANIANQCRHALCNSISAAALHVVCIQRRIAKYCKQKELQMTHAICTHNAVIDGTGVLHD
jgi:hypothetical protein